MSRKTAVKWWRRICGTVAVLGFMFILGTAGASDLDLIPMKQILTQCAIGLAAMFGGAWLGGFMQ